MAPSMLGGHDAPNRTTRTAPWSELVNCLSPVFAAWDGAVAPGETVAKGHDLWIPDRSATAGTAAVASP